MKTNDCRSAKLFAMTCVAALLTLPLLAQEQKSTNDSTKREKPSSEQPRFQGGRFVPAFGRFMEVLTDEQRTSLQQAMAGQHEKARELEEKTRDLRRAILEASATQEFDESTVRSKALALAKFDAELTVLRARALSKMRPPLSAEQLEKIKNATDTPAAPGNGTRRGQRDVPRDENGLPPKQ